MTIKTVAVPRMSTLDDGRCCAPDAACRSIRAAVSLTGYIDRRDRQTDGRTPVRRIDAYLEAASGKYRTGKLTLDAGKDAQQEAHHAQGAQGAARRRSGGGHRDRGSAVRLRLLGRLERPEPGRHVAAHAVPLLAHLHAAARLARRRLAVVAVQPPRLHRHRRGRAGGGDRRAGARGDAARWTRRRPQDHPHAPEADHHQADRYGGTGGRRRAAKRRRRAGDRRRRRRGHPDLHGLDGDETDHGDCVQRRRGGSA